MPDILLSDALRLAINIFREASESARTPSGITLDPPTAELHVEAADTLETALTDMADLGH